MNAVAKELQLREVLGEETVEAQAGAGDRLPPRMPESQWRIPWYRLLKRNER